MVYKFQFIHFYTKFFRILKEEHSFRISVKGKIIFIFYRVILATIPRLYSICFNEWIELTDLLSTHNVDLSQISKTHSFVLVPLKLVYEVNVLNKLFFPPLGNKQVITAQL